MLPGWHTFCEKAAKRLVITVVSEYWSPAAVETTSTLTYRGRGLRRRAGRGVKVRGGKWKYNG